MKHYPHLFSPWQIGSLSLKNRIVMAPMGTGYADERHCVTDQLVEYLRLRAEGGVGLIITEHTAVHPTGLTSPRMLAIFSEEQAEGFSRLAEAVHQHGAKIAVQLQHGGRQANPEVIGCQCLAPSDVPAGRDRRMARAMSEAEIADIIRAFADAAWRCKQAGIDGVEIHMAHGYLGASFLSPLLNRREDRYGGDTRRRCTFAIELAEAIGEKCGADFPLWARVSADEFLVGGMTLDEMRRIAPILQEAGYMAIHVSACMGETAQYASAPYYRPQGHLLHLAEGVKREVDIPVIGVGNIIDPAYADEAIAKGRCDAIALGRALLADPNWPRKAAEGKRNDIRPCILCNTGCLGRAAPPEGHTQCAVNPQTGREALWNPFMPPAERKMKIAVIGAGPAGIAFAIYARQRGHEVEIYERSHTVGGALALACQAPGKEVFARYLSWLRLKLLELSIPVHLGREIRPQDLAALGTDAVVIATGARCGIDCPPGLGGAIPAEQVLAALGLRRVISPPDIPACPKIESPAVIIGGGRIGLETAHLLAVCGVRCTVLEKAHAPGRDMHSAARYFLLRELELLGVRVLTGHEAARVEDGAVVARDPCGRDAHIEAACAIVACGRAPLPVAADLKRGFEPSFLIGDAAEPRDLLWANYEAARLAREI